MLKATLPLIVFLSVGILLFLIQTTDPLDQSSQSFPENSLRTKVSDAATCIVINRPLFRGLSDSLTGGQVSELQSFLKSQGYFSEAVTGFFGPSTETAVKKFQKRYTIALFGGVSTTGFGATGPITRAKIKSISCYVPLPPRSTPIAQTPATTPPAVTSPVAEPPATPPTTGALSVTCRPSPTAVGVGSPVNWRATIVSAPSGSTSHTYNWQGTDNLVGDRYSVQKNYSTAGSKSAAVTVDGRLFNCSISVTVTVEPPPPEEEEEEEDVVWPPSGLSERPLYGSTDSPNDQNYNYTTHRYRILLSNDLSTNVQYALSKMSNMPEGRRFYTSIASDAQHRIVGTHSGDNCKSVVDGVETLTNFPCPWWDNGVNQAQDSFRSFASAFASAGGEMDFIFFDTEQHLTNWLIQSDDHANAIENDPRFRTLLSQLESSFGFGPSDNPLRNSVTRDRWGGTATPQPQAADNYLKWNELNNDMTAEFLEGAFFDPIKSSFSTVKAAEHNYAYHSQSHKIQDANGHRISDYGNGAIVGTHQSRTLYGSLGNISRFEYLSPIPGEIYEASAFNAFKYDQNQMRAMRLSSGAPIAPEFATRFWGGDSAYNVRFSNTDYYQENILHAAMVSKSDDHFLLWSNLTASGDRIFDDTLTEFNEVAGYNRTLLTNDLVDWDADAVFTGVRIGDYKVWRFTPEITGGRRIADFISNDGNPNGSEPVVFDVNGDTATFSNAFIYTPSNPVSSFGAWVIQQASAPNPR